MNVVSVIKEYDTFVEGAMRVCEKGTNVVWGIKQGLPEEVKAAGWGIVGPGSNVYLWFSGKNSILGLSF